MNEIVETASIKRCNSINLKKNSQIFYPTKITNYTVKKKISDRLRNLKEHLADNFFFLYIDFLDFRGIYHFKLINIWSNLSWLIRICLLFGTDWFNCFWLFGIVLCQSLPQKCWSVSESWMSELAGLSDHILTGLSLRPPSPPPSKMM